jgi:serine/threonine protein kinase
MPEIDEPLKHAESRPSTPPPEVLMKHERRKSSKLVILFNQLLHLEHHAEEAIRAPKTQSHFPSKSACDASKLDSSISRSSSAKTNPSTPRPPNNLKVTHKILEFLHLKDREGAELDVEISEDELDMLRETVPMIHDRHDLSFKLKYHFIGSKIIGRGASGIVRLAASNASSSDSESEEERFAVKEMRRKKKQETCDEYLKKLIREFRIAMLMHHSNVINTLDFVMIGDKWYEVMEYCSGGDLFAAIQRGKMGQEEIDCCFKQIVHGVKYLHERGVSHRDLKPENLLIDSKGQVKITDFGVSEVFCDLDWYCDGDIQALKSQIYEPEDHDQNEEFSNANGREKYVHKLKGLCGSCPYIAPEEFLEAEYDGRFVDVWSLGIIYYAMIFHSVPWEMAHPKNSNFKQFLEDGFDSFESFNRLPSKPRALLKQILEPDPLKRITIEEILQDPWFQKVRTCTENDEEEVCVLNTGAETTEGPSHKRALSYNYDLEQEDMHQHM